MNECINTHTKYASFFFFQEKCMDDDDDGWSDDGDEYDKYVLPPCLLHGVRLCMMNGSVDIGYSPTTDGYGNVDMCVTIIINYPNEFLVLNKTETADLFTAVRSWNYSHSIGSPRRVFTGCNDILNGQCIIKKKIGDVYTITATSDEGDIQVINEFKHEDMVKLWEMRWIIEGRIECMQLDVRNIIAKIEDFADKYRNNPDRIIEDASSWSCDSIFVEIACNFMQFFNNFIVEKNNVVDDEEEEE